VKVMHSHKLFIFYFALHWWWWWWWLCWHND